MSKRPIAKPKTLWEDDVLEDTKNMNARNWKKVAQNRDRWKKVVGQARNLYRLQYFIRRRHNKLHYFIV
jgi:GH24 family phage-related lysozyme (muramidase)